MLRLIALVAVCVLACTPAGVQELQILSKGGPLVSVAINGAEALSVSCNGGVVLRPGDQGTPPLPWDLKVVDQTTGRVVFDQRIAELPRWLLIQRNTAGVSASPILGPFVPCAGP
jgi:hypothetical protein